MTTLTTANANLQDIARILEGQQGDKLDAVVPAQAVRARDGLLHVQGLSVFEGEKSFRPTALMDGQIAGSLGIPTHYLRKIREERLDLYDANVNGWLHGNPLPRLTRSSLQGDNPDGRKFLLRTFVNDADPEGIHVGRAFLSDRYSLTMDNLDVLLAALDGIRQSGVECYPVRANLSETRMSVRFAAPSIRTVAPNLLENYRSPISPEKWQAYAARHGLDVNDPRFEPVVFAGFDLDNSETGGGAFNLVPVVSVLICLNGQRVPAKGLRKIHLGSKLEEGVVNYGSDTQQKNIELVTLQTRDAVKTYLSEGFLAETVSGVEKKAGVVLDNPAEQVQLVTKQMKYSESASKGILDHFIKGGQSTAGGVMNAVTSYAQTVEDPDVTWELENSALQALDKAAALVAA